VERKVFSAPSRESNRRSLAYETSMVPQDHCQRTALKLHQSKEHSILPTDCVS
jgi:hypothetical protein